MIIQQQGEESIHCIISGKLANAPEIAYYSRGTKAKFAVGVDKITNEYQERKTVFMNVECWGAVADYASLLEKGDSVFVAGIYREQTWTGRDGKERIFKAITADIIYAQSLPGQALLDTPKEEQIKNKPEKEKEQLSSEDDGLPF